MKAWHAFVDVLLSDAAKMVVWVPIIPSEVRAGATYHSRVIWKPRWPWKWACLFYFCWPFNLYISHLSTVCTFFSSHYPFQNRTCAHLKEKGETIEEDHENDELYDRRAVRTKRRYKPLLYYVEMSVFLTFVGSSLISFFWKSFNTPVSARTDDCFRMALSMRIVAWHKHCYRCARGCDWSPWEKERRSFNCLKTIEFCILEAEYKWSAMEELFLRYFTLISSG